MKHLVIVDDEKEVTEALRREIGLLFSGKDFIIDAFTDPKEALAFVRENEKSVFLLITDLRMPRMSGDELLETVRRENSRTRTILMTAYSDLETIQKAVGTSLQSLIMKPWTVESLLYEIQKAEHSWELETENEQLKKQLSQLLQEAGDFQRRLYSASLPSDSRIRYSIAFNPLDKYGSGGDFYEIIPTHQGQCILLGDVAGHGPRAAMVAAMMKSLLYVYKRQQRSYFVQPELLLESLNQEVFNLLNASPDVLIALCAVHVNLMTKELTIANAGQPSPLLCRGEDGIQIGDIQPLLGGDPAYIYHHRTFSFQPGVRMILHSDGLINIPDTDGNSGVSRNSLREMMVQESSRRPLDAAEAILRTIKQVHMTDSDDITVIVADLLPQEAGDSP